MSLNTILPLTGLTFLLTALPLNSRAGDPAFQPKRDTLGRLERAHPDFDRLITPDAKIEVLAEGFDWSEGPVWVEAGRYLLFSDVPRNVVYRWQAGEGISVHLQPSGYTGAPPRGGEPGSNGLTLDRQGRLVLCQHGDRRVARLQPGGGFVTLADRYQGKRFNSPNDLVYHPNGDLFFTDPPYGLEGNIRDPQKELPFQGIFRLSPDGALSLLSDKVTFPNGIALSPDARTVYVAVSDPKRPVILAFDLREDRTLGDERVFFDAQSLRGEGRPGLPDGLKVDQAGNVFSTGPGGVLVISPAGRLLGTIFTGQATANCAWGDDGSVLYITADSYLCRIQTKTRGSAG